MTNAQGGHGPRHPGRPRIVNPGYAAIHVRQQRDHGKAAEHLCSSCLEQAGEWADLGDLAEFTPLCASCHRWFDRKGVMYG